ncbi:MAG: winged helix-turn-helix domain-containing protein [archaeon YNP-LCB-003-016]|uniref:ArsR/SmtB family transcription factor n=1 Tax=Candidatus Culexarchaeum yellowstonense TaxID=2928963 RepID=UPI0026EC4319|nr:winged helix-turn-helix domain-containing protein [Candidatus Culexarchaeum yellowstonense]MCR6690877.1 winged helix-turn-helix domain-containing protein [Candidatus Culexarchaeum yellowstonense]
MSDQLNIEDMKILSEETRIKIIKLLYDKGELGLNEISEQIKKAKSTTSEHLKILLENEFIVRIQTERGYRYKLAEKGVKAVKMLYEGEEIKLQKKPTGVNIQIILRQRIPWIRSAIPAITGATMIILSGTPHIIIALSILNGALLGIMKSKFKDIVMGGVIFSFITSIISVGKIGVIAMPITLALSIIIYICVGGLTWAIIKLVIKHG